MKKKLLVICGPTATGKTALAVKLAKQFNAELISADSRQVYQGMDVGTGKDLSRNSKFQIPNSKMKLKIQNFQIGYYLIQEVPIWLLDLVKPDYRFSAGDYALTARPVIEDIWQRNKLPIVVGGTGFYIQALIDGVETLGVTPDWQLRQRLENWSIEKLVKHLQKIAPAKWEQMNQSDRHNPRRLIRAIEIARAKKKITIHNSQFIIQDLLIIGLMAPLKILYQRIDRRVRQRVEQGALKEISKLLTAGYNWDNSVLGETIGYQEFKPYWEKKINLAGAVKNWQFAEHRYARRQMTWFRKVLNLSKGEWFDITNDAWQEKVVKLIKAW